MVFNALALNTTSGLADDMMMQMYFYAGRDVTLLFKEWTVSSNGDYAGSLIAVFLLAIAYEWGKKARSDFDKSLVAANKHSAHESSTLLSVKDVGRVSFAAQAIRAGWHMLHYTLAYMLMLCFMTYNAGVCVVMILGSTVGYFLFSPLAAGETEASCH